jgi:hypothetical protein
MERNHAHSGKMTKIHLGVVHFYEIYFKSFKYKAKQLWLWLPDDLANAESEYIFKTKLFKLLLSEQIQKCQLSLLDKETYFDS